MIIFTNRLVVKIMTLYKYKVWLVSTNLEVFNLFDFALDVEKINKTLKTYYCCKDRYMKGEKRNEYCYNWWA